MWYGFVWVCCVAALSIAEVFAAEKILDKVKVENISLALEDIAGVTRRPFELGEDKTSVLIFVMRDCPIANAYAPEIHRVIDAYEKRKVRFALVYVDTDTKKKEVERHREEFGHSGYVAFIDSKHVLVKATGVTVTPEAVVIGKDGRIVYRGRINNLYADLGKRRRAASQHDLRKALDSVLEGKPVATPRTRALGCYIEALE